MIRKTRIQGTRVVTAAALLLFGATAASAGKLPAIGSIATPAFDGSRVVNPANLAGASGTAFSADAQARLSLEGDLSKNIDDLRTIANSAVGKGQPVANPTTPADFIENLNWSHEGFGDNSRIVASFESLNKPGAISGDASGNFGWRKGSFRVGLSTLASSGVTAHGDMLNIMPESAPDQPITAAEVDGMFMMLDPSLPAADFFTSAQQSAIAAAYEAKGVSATSATNLALSMNSYYSGQKGGINISSDQALLALTRVADGLGNPAAGIIENNPNSETKIRVRMLVGYELPLSYGYRFYDANGIKLDAGVTGKVTAGSVYHNNFSPLNSDLSSGFDDIFDNEKKFVTGSVDAGITARVQKLALAVVGNNLIEPHYGTLDGFAMKKEREFIAGIALDATSWLTLSGDVGLNKTASSPLQPGLESREMKLQAAVRPASWLMVSASGSRDVDNSSAPWVLGGRIAIEGTNVSAFIEGAGSPESTTELDGKSVPSETSAALGLTIKF